MPFDKIVAEVCPDAKLRRLVQNMIYDGVLSQLLSIDLGEMEKALSQAARQEAEGDGAQHGRARGGQEVRGRASAQAAIRIASSG